MTTLEYWLSKQRWLWDDLSPSYQRYWKARDDLSTLLDEIDPWVFPDLPWAGRGDEGMLTWWRWWLGVLRANPSAKAGAALCLEEIRKLIGGNG